MLAAPSQKGTKHQEAARRSDQNYKGALKQATNKSSKQNLKEPQGQNFYLSQSGPNQMNSNLAKMRKEQEVDYNYNINLGNQNPLLNSVQTQQSLKNGANKGSGLNISKLEALKQN